jgi:hypothetical protein
MYQDQTICVFGLNAEYGIVCSRRYYGECLTDRRLVHEANWLRHNNGRIDKIYAIEESEDVYDAYKASCRSHTMEDRIVFKVLLEQQGLCLA